MESVAILQGDRKIFHRGKPAGDSLLDALVDKGVEFWHDHCQQAYATANGKTILVTSTQFQSALARVGVEHGIRSTASALRDAQQQAVALAIAGDQHRAWCRVAWSGDREIEWVFGNTTRTLVISPDGWRLANAPSQRITVTAGAKAVGNPVECADISVLSNWLHVSPMLYIWALASLHPGREHPILFLRGEQGAGKSTIMTALVQSLDAAAPTRMQMPGRKDMPVVAASRWLLPFDNVSSIDANASDLICRIATGAGISKRQLYTDQGTVSLDISRPIIINGISDVSDRPDLLDRSLTLNVTKPAERSSDGDIWERLSLAQPQILGFLAGALSRCLRADWKRLGTSHRMDALLGWAAGGLEGLADLDGAAAEIDSAAKAARGAVVDTDPLASAVRALASYGRFEMPPIEAFVKLSVQGDKLKATARFGDWPRSVPEMIDRLRRLSPALRSKGVRCDVSDAGGNVIVIIEPIR